MRSGAAAWDEAVCSLAAGACRSERNLGYTAKRWGVDQADRYIRQIVTTCADLAGGQKQGRSIHDVRPGYFKYPTGSHVLFYRLTAGGEVVVVRILHQRMDVGRHL